MKQRFYVFFLCELLGLFFSSLPSFLAASIFSGKYGSELEFKLESDLDMLLDQKQRINIAKYKWQNSRVLITHAVNQMKYAVKKWSELMHLPNMLVSSFVSHMFDNCIHNHF